MRKIWIAMLLSVIAVLGLDGCRHAQKVTGDNGNNDDNKETRKERKIRQGEIICLYGSPDMEWRVNE